MRNDHTYLDYIRERIERVQLYAGEGEDFFRTDPRTQDARLRLMETLADAVAHLSSDLKARHTHIHWRQISDFRNVLAHGYAQIRLDQVWQAVIHDLPALRTMVDQELADG